MYVSYNHTKIHLHHYIHPNSHFVPNLTIGPPIVSSLRSTFPSVFLDCHLMIESPELWVERIHRAGASSITFHLEATADPLALVTRIKREMSGCKCGIAIKPDTPVSALSQDILVLLDMVLVMTVEPGFGGQKLLPKCIEKVRELRFERGFAGLIQVDGGVDEGNAGILKEAGADILVAGSSIFNSTTTPSNVINHFKQ